MSRITAGLVVWGLGLALALGLPGSVWRQAAPPGFPWAAVGPTILAVGALSLLAPLAAWWGGPGLASRRSLALLEAPPDLLWAGLLLALWPAAWGPPGLGGWLVAFLVAALPGEARWLAQAMPAEHPFPLERILGVPGLGTDWMTRVAVRDRAGLAGWILALALLWLLSQRLDREVA